MLLGLTVFLHPLMQCPGPGGRHGGSRQVLVWGSTDDPEATGRSIAALRSCYGMSAASNDRALSTPA